MFCVAHPLQASGLSAMSAAVCQPACSQGQGSQDKHTRYMYLNFLGTLLAARGGETEGQAAHDDLHEALKHLKETAEAMGGDPAFQRSMPNIHRRIAELSLDVGDNDEVWSCMSTVPSRICWLCLILLVTVLADITTVLASS